MEKDLNYWKKNAEEDYMKVPISVLRYITELEKAVLPQADATLPTVDEIMSEWTLVGAHKPYWMNSKWDRQTRAMLEWILEKVKRQ